MADDFFKEDILDNAISHRQRERRERCEALHQKKVQRAERNAAAAARAKQARRYVLVTALVAVLAAFFVGRSVFNIIRLSKEKAEAQAKLEELNQKIELLSSELQRVTSDEYIEMKARSELRMIFPGETLYIVVPANSPAASQSGNASNN